MSETSQVTMLSIGGASSAKYGGGSYPVFIDPQDNLKKVIVPGDAVDELLGAGFTLFDPNLNTTIINIINNINDLGSNVATAQADIQSAQIAIENNDGSITVLSAASNSHEASILSLSSETSTLTTSVTNIESQLAWASVAADLGPTLYLPLVSSPYLFTNNYGQLVWLMCYEQSALYSDTTTYQFSKDAGATIYASQTGSTWDSTIAVHRVLPAAVPPGTSVTITWPGINPVIVVSPYYT